MDSELDAGVLEAVQMLRGLVADPEAPAGARVRAATALMDRAGLTPAYAVEIKDRLYALIARETPRLLAPTAAALKGFK